ncbi:MAG: epoxyqueuosine reductase QueH [Patescibacteria group bacterium]|nr:epoxyqueuosine reductase QueH [Patescibacteria group bacterium]MCL5261845.1 epoxyqueuosine reductase QueH [Patescibacteria group bacterium]
MNQEDKPKILLHVCCAVCGALLLKILKERFEPIVFYFNPNIYPKKEYLKRLESAEKLALLNQTDFIEGKYDFDSWREAVHGLEREPEGGRRCPVCFGLRLRRTAAEARERNISFFATTLSVSPYKNEAIIDRLAEMISKETGVEFLSLGQIFPDKKDLWRKTREADREAGFYHQKYCGCEFSLKQPSA